MLSLWKSRWLWIIGGVLLVSSLGVGTTWSYLKTAHTSIGQTIRDATPIEFELKRLEQAIGDLLPEIRANQKVAAQLEVESEYLEKELQAMQDSQAEEFEKMKQLREALREDKDEYTFGGRTFTRQQVEDDLDRRLRRYEDIESQIAAKQKILESRRRTLAAATAKIQEYRHQHNLLCQKAESLKADLKNIELAQAAGRFEFDESQLKRTKDLAGEVEVRIRTLQRVIEQEWMVDEGIPVDVDKRSVTERFDQLPSKQSAG